jgi:hypothetical protein
MVAEDILHSHGGLQTYVVTEKKIIAYERENPWYNTQKGDGIVRSCNSVATIMIEKCRRTQLRTVPITERPCLCYYKLSNSSF